MEKVCLIDGSGYIFRAFFASPTMTNPEGLPVNAVYGFLNMFLSLTQNIKCDYCLVLFDAKRQNFRNEIFKDYKATRPELPEDLKPQFALIHEVVEALNLHWLQMEGYEADDLIATYTNLALKDGKEVTIVSADKDLMQLIREGVTFYDSMKNKFFTPEDVKEKFGVYPERVTDVQALAGDSTDNIPGVPGIGIKTAAELVNQFGSLEGVLDHADEIKQNKRRELIQTHKEDALISQKLVTLKADVPVEIALKDLRCLAPHEDVLLNLLDRHAFRSLKNKALNWLKAKCSDLPQEEKKLTPSYKLVKNKTDLAELINAIKAKNMFAFAPVSYKESLLGLSVSLKDAKAFYIPLVQTAEPVDLFSAPKVSDGIEAKELTHFLSELFNNPAILKIALGLKEHLHFLEKSLHHEFNAFPYDDVAIMSYDLYSLTLQHTLPALSITLLNQNLKLTADEYKKADLSTLTTAEQLSLFAETADFTMRLHQKLRPQLLPEKKLFLYENIDQPMSQILQNMERTGIMLDVIKLKNLDKRFDSAMNTLSEEIYAMAGETFNLSSPKQIGEILYNKLGLKGKKHISGSLNTSAEVLEQMAETHELPKKILEWRQYQKLKSTYTSALLEQMDKESRIHTTYSLTSVNTGRLSSYNPNLQNIPIRTPVGREIRECFIAKAGHKIIAADYSQVELRLLATIADVKFLQTAFGENVDIHRKTAAQVFGIPYEEVDSDHRRRAKAINFGIIYGMSAYGLSKEIDVPPAVAQQYIDAYFAEMPEVKKYMETTINFYHQNSYVLTPFNRKIAIPLPENKQLGAMYDKAAINAPIQGGAADIIKMAMGRVEAMLKENNFKTKMLLQIHDELVFEAPIDEVEKVTPLIKQAMENVTGIELKVPLIAEVGIGDNWGAAH
jgi:DNA polymerase-1